jgi:hypothetical protein
MLVINVQETTLHKYRYFYFLTGVNSLARIELGDSSVYANFGKLRYVPHDVWGDTNVTSLPRDSKQRGGMTRVFLNTAADVTTAYPIGGATI